MRSLTLILSLILSVNLAGAAVQTRVNGNQIVTGTIAAGTTNVANTKSVLDLVSTTKGMLPPRMTTTQRDAITSPPAGLTIYNTTLSRLNYYTGAAWVDAATLTGTEELTNKLISGSTNTIYNVSLSTGVTGTLPLNKGGTGFTTKAAAFDALSPMTTSGDIIYGGASGTGTRLAKGSDGDVFTLSSGLPTWAAPATSPSKSYEVSNVGLATSVGSSALTIALTQSDGSSNCSAGSPCKIGFRSSTATSGAYNQRSITGALSTVISSGSTAGFTNAVQGTIYVYAIDNAGTVELAWSRSLLIDNGSVYTTTAEGGAGAADASTTLYSTTARSNVPIRLIGRLKATEATAGTWATAPSEVSVLPFQYASVSSGDTQQMRLEWVNVSSCGTSGSSLGNQSGSWAASISNGGSAGCCTINFTAGMFVGNVTCVGTVAGAWKTTSMLSADTTGAVFCNGDGSTGSGTNGVALTAICMGAK